MPRCFLVPAGFREAQERVANALRQGRHDVERLFELLRVRVVRRGRSRRRVSTGSSEAPIAFLSGDLPHWRQQAVTYFVTFRLADSLPQEKLHRWREERERWMAEHPEPLDEATRRDYYERFPQPMQQWLDADTGSCILARAEVNSLIEGALRHFNGERYSLDEFVEGSPIDGSPFSGSSGRRGRSPPLRN